jgi:transitional endoplasmic reticulum ATPase
MVDSALLRPGRFDRIIEVPKPDAKGRKHIFEIHTKKKPLESDVNLAKLVEMTNGYSGAEIAAVCDRAAFTALRRYVNDQKKTVKEIRITQNDLVEAVRKVRVAPTSTSAVA